MAGGSDRPVFPARAGMNRRKANPAKRASSVPRTRGDEPDAAGSFLGKLCVFPARAGMNRLRWLPLLRCCCVPRTRGDEPVVTTRRKIT